MAIYMAQRSRSVVFLRQQSQIFYSRLENFMSIITTGYYDFNLYFFECAISLFSGTISLFRTLAVHVQYDIIVDRSFCFGLGIC